MTLKFRAGLSPDNCSLPSAQSLSAWASSAQVSSAWFKEVCARGEMG